MADKSTKVNNKGGDLNQKQEIFVREYLVDGNGARAAKAAGYGKNSAAAAASRLLTNVNIQKKLSALTSNRLEKLDISAERVLQGIAQVAFFDVRKFFNADGSLKAVADLDERTAFALKGLDVEKLFHHFGKGQAEEKGTITKVRFADRLEALEMLGRNLKLFTDKLEITDAQAIVERLQQGRARVAVMKR